jgi:hypothetical protein
MTATLPSRLKDFQKHIDVFLSFPMAAVGDTYGWNRSQALRLVKGLSQIPGCRQVYFAGERIPTPLHFDDSAIALRDCIDALQNCRFFMMVYPTVPASSVILEAGMALSMGKPGVIFHEGRAHLPFLLQNVTDVVPTMRLRKAHGVDQILSLLEDEVAPRLRPTT